MKARAGEAYCELLTEHDHEPWHYLMLIENEPAGRDDLTWWELQTETLVGDLLRHHERLPLFPDAGGPTSGRPFPVLDVRPTGGREAVPVYGLVAAAGGFGASQSPEPVGWALVKTRRALDGSMFIAKVEGHSMEDGIPDGSYCLFRGFAAGDAPNAIALDGRRVVVELRETAEAELGGRYTLKRWKVAAMGSDGGAAEVELRPDNRAYRTLRLRGDDGDIRVVAEMLEVIA